MAKYLKKLFVDFQNRSSSTSGGLKWPEFWTA